jgi:rfaE bifunctional protein nucleotidyltransferase chain/domain
MSAPPAVPSGRILARVDLARILPVLRAGPPARRVALANGCFDLLHAGHVSYLEDARSRGELLVVALNTDASVRGLKGPSRPAIPFAERARVVAALRAVDFVIPFGEPTLEATLRSLRPEVHAKGSDYTTESVPERAIDRELGIEIAICGEAKLRSSTELLARSSARGSGAEERGPAAR